MRGRDPDLGQDTDGVRLPGRLYYPGQDQRPERLLAEAHGEFVVGVG
jgi:hypothetical protein